MVMGKKSPNRPNGTARPMTLATQKLRMRKSSSLTIGSPTRRSHQTKMVKTTALTSSSPSVCGLVQPNLGPSINA
jgi:hypothetical protein